MKKVMSLLLVLLLFAMAIPAVAEGSSSYTITINNETSGHTYEAYQIFTGRLDVVEGKNVLSDIVWGSGVTGAGQTALLSFGKGEGEEAYADAAALADALNEGNVKDFAKEAAKYLQNPTESNWNDGAKNYTISGLAAGYYLVKDKDNTLDNKEHDFYTAYILEVVANTTANPKGEKPTLEKEIKNKESWGVVGSHQIGDTVEFRTISTVPDTTGYTAYTYTIHDTMSEGLTSNVKSVADVTIKVNDTTVLDQTYYTVAVDEQNSNAFTVTIDILKAVEDGKLEKGNKLYTYYSGVLNENAKVYNDKQDNTAYLVYSNNPNDAEGKETGKTPDDKVYDWTFKVDVNKVDGDEKQLKDAMFVLSRNGNLKVEDMKCGTDGTPTVTTNLINLVKGSDAEYRVAKEGEASTTYVINAGEVVIKGLEAGVDYYLYETKAPAGYSMLTEPVKFKINASYNYNTEGSELAAGSPTLTVGTAEASTSLKIDVVNKAGATLPSTGGIGTTVFYIVGGALVLVAVVLLVTKKKMSVNKD